jgi:hypothetical protein
MRDPTRDVSADPDLDLAVWPQDPDLPPLERHTFTTRLQLGAPTHLSGWVRLVVDIDRSPRGDVDA